MSSQKKNDRIALEILHYFTAFFWPKHYSDVLRENIIAIQKDQLMDFPKSRNLFFTFL